MGTSQKKEPKVSGTKKEDVVFADKIGCQTNKVYTKLSDLKKDSIKA